MYGVPQTRRRAVLIARRDGTAKLPKPTHQPYQKDVPPLNGGAKILPWVSMESALDRPEPFVVVSNYGTGGDPKARGRRYSHQPSATVTGKNFAKPSGFAQRTRASSVQPCGSRSTTKFPQEPPLAGP